jgi:hypothetical protein
VRGIDGNDPAKGGKASFQILFNERERKGPGNLNLQGGLFPSEPSFPFGSGLTKEDIFSGYPDLVKLALDDLVDQKNLFRKILLGERFFFRQIGHSAKGQKDAEEEGEKVTDPTP